MESQSNQRFSLKCECLCVCLGEVQLSLLSGVCKLWKSWKPLVCSCTAYTLKSLGLTYSVHSDKESWEGEGVEKGREWASVCVCVLGNANYHFISGSAATKRLGTGPKTKKKKVVFGLCLEKWASNFSVDNGMERGLAGKSARAPVCVCVIFRQSKLSFHFRICNQKKSLGTSVCCISPFTTWNVLSQRSTHASEQKQNKQKKSHI